LEQHNAWLTSELATKSQALARERQAAAVRETELASKLDAADKSGNDSKTEASRAKERVKALEVQLEQAQRKHRDAVDAASAQERQFTEELNTVRGEPAGSVILRAHERFGWLLTISGVFWIWIVFGMKNVSSTISMSQVLSM
jgi:hypothetical protein